MGRSASSRNLLVREPTDFQPRARLAARLLYQPTRTRQISPSMSFRRPLHSSRVRQSRSKLHSPAPPLQTPLARTRSRTGRLVQQSLLAWPQWALRCACFPCCASHLPPAGSPVHWSGSARHPAAHPVLPLLREIQPLARWIQPAVVPLLLQDRLAPRCQDPSWMQ